MPALYIYLPASYLSLTEKNSVDIYLDSFYLLPINPNDLFIWINIPVIHWIIPGNNLEVIR